MSSLALRNFNRQRRPLCTVYIGFIVSIGNASPFRVQVLNPCTAACCLTIVISMISSGFTDAWPAFPKRV